MTTDGHRRRREIGERVAVMLCGYGEVEDNDELTEYNRKSIDLLVSKSIRFPARLVPFISRQLARRARAEYESANDFISPHNAIFERQRDLRVACDVDVLLRIAANGDPEFARLPDEPYRHEMGAAIAAHAAKPDVARPPTAQTRFGFL